jgi:hypothetical protein
VTRDALWRPAVVLAALAALLTIAARADFSGPDWRYFKDLTGPQATGFQVVTLDPEVLASAQPGLFDLRLIGEDSAEVPYQVQAQTEERRVEPVAARLYNLSRVPGKGTRFELDLGPGGAATTDITINTPSANFRYQVVVEGSNDARDWAVLRADGAIFDFTKDVSARSTTVNMPETRFRYLRVTVRDAGGPPLKVDGASAAREVSRPAERAGLKVLTTSIRQDPKRRATDVWLDLGYPRQPFDTVDVLFPDDNVKRRCEVCACDGPDRPALVASSVLFRYHTSTFTGEQTRLTFGEARGRYVIVSICNGDNPPLKVSGARLYGVPRSIVFSAGQGRRLRLFYGANARPPEYDLSEFLKLQPVATGTVLALAPQQENPAYRPPRQPWTEERPWLMWVIIAVAGLVIGGLIIRLMVGIGPPGEGTASGAASR